jgi:nicotinate phosphoribosyltransferase
MDRPLKELLKGGVLLKELKSVEDVWNFKINNQERIFHSATHEEIIKGGTADLYFVRTRELLAAAGKENTVVVAEIFCSREGVLAGVEEVFNLLKHKNVSLWAIPEGEEMQQKEVIMRIKGPYDEFAMYETALLGMLASASGWATAARACKEASGSCPVFCFGARHVHPAVAPVMERASIIGGADNCSCILGAKLLEKEPVGTVPHAAVMIIGDTVETALLYDGTMPPDSPRIMLVDTFKDEAEETLRVAEALKEKLSGVRLDTPRERGGVTPELVREVRARLDQKGFSYVQILVSGGITAERIPQLIEAGADAFGVGSYISAARPIDMTMDLKEIDGRPIAKRGRIPGITDNPRLVCYL